MSFETAAGREVKIFNLSPTLLATNAPATSTANAESSPSKGHCLSTAVVVEPATNLIHRGQSGQYIKIGLTKVDLDDPLDWFQVSTSEEVFVQIAGESGLIAMEGGQPKEVPLKSNFMFVLPARIPRRRTAECPVVVMSSVSSLEPQQLSRSSAGGDDESYTGPGYCLTLSRCEKSASHNSQPEPAAALRSPSRPPPVEYETFALLYGRNNTNAVDHALLSVERTVPIPHGSSLAEIALLQNRASSSSSSKEQCNESAETLSLPPSMDHGVVEEAAKWTDSSSNATVETDTDTLLAKPVNLIDRIHRLSQREDPIRLHNGAFVIELVGGNTRTPTLPIEVESWVWCVEGSSAVINESLVLKRGDCVIVPDRIENLSLSQDAAIVVAYLSEI